MNQEQQSFKDPQTLIAIVLVFLIFVGWNFYMKNKYPDLNKPPVAVESESGEPSVVDKIVVKNEQASDTVSGTTLTSGVQGKQWSEKSVVVENDMMTVQLSSDGFNLNNVVLKHYRDKEKNNYTFGLADLGSLIIRDSSGRKIKFDTIERSGSEVLAVSENEKTKVIARVVFSNNYDFDLQIQVMSAVPSLEGIKIELMNKIQKTGASSFFMPNYDIHEVYVLLADGVEERVDISEPASASFKAVNLFAIDSQYFASAVVDSSAIMPSINIAAGEQTVNVLATYSPITKMEEFKVSLKGYLGPKDSGILTAADSRLINTINFGMFSFLARPLIGLLRWFHGISLNWGVAIILMTILVKLAVLPFNLMSYKSMKAMQKVQPAMQALREKFKDDPQRLNQEMMNLMKVHKVNPLGGCLPMLLQLPVFIALYQVLGQSIELYQAPFFGWITDLSEKDPYYILPVLMGITMFFQMRMTPTTMDPNQAKIMAFMPVVFTLFMVSLPSGLTLYIFVSTLFTVIQQLIFMNDRSQPVATQSAKA